MTLTRLAAAAVLAAIVLAACGGTAETPRPTTPAPATPAPTASASPPPAATPVAFVSAAYDYAATFPAETRPRHASARWDSEARIDATGQYTDHVNLPGSILFFVYGAPTDLDLEAYAARTQAQIAAWHDCPASPDSVTDIALDGTPGRLHRMTCLGTYVQKLMVVRDGQGLVVNMLAPPNLLDEASSLFEELVAAMTWPA
jgi:hypothetical protein